MFGRRWFRGANWRTVLSLTLRSGRASGPEAIADASASNQCLARSRQERAASLNVFWACESFARWASSSQSAALPKHFSAFFFFLFTGIGCLRAMQNSSKPAWRPPCAEVHALRIDLSQRPVFRQLGGATQRGCGVKRAPRGRWGDEGDVAQNDAYAPTADMRRSDESLAPDPQRTCYTRRLPQG